MRIDIISDTVCPWCYIGKKRLEEALAQRPDMEFEIYWHPFQLNPEMPQEGADRKAHYLEKFGSEEGVKELHEQVEEAGKSAGIDFAFEKSERVPNTIASHQLIALAGEEGKQDEVVEDLFQRYFNKGEDIGSPDILRDAAKAADIDTGALDERLGNEDHAELIRREDQAARQIGVQGVPVFIFEQKYAVVGAQEPDNLVQIIDQVKEEIAKGESGQTPANDDGPGGAA